MTRDTVPWGTPAPGDWPVYMGHPVVAILKRGEKGWHERFQGSCRTNMFAHLHRSGLVVVLFPTVEIEKPPDPSAGGS